MFVCADCPKICTLLCTYFCKTLIHGREILLSHKRSKCPLSGQCVIDINDILDGHAYMKIVKISLKENSISRVLLTPWHTLCFGVPPQAIAKWRWGVLYFWSMFEICLWNPSSLWQCHNALFFTLLVYILSVHVSLSSTAFICRKFYKQPSEKNVHWLIWTDYSSVQGKN